MIVPAILALVLSFIIYIGIGLYHRKFVKNLGDIIPVKFGSTAKVANSTEFSATTTAATVSLATVVVAFFELVPNLGWWLLWPAITTAIGLIVFSLIVKRIWLKMSEYGHRPSMHEFLGVEFKSPSVAIVGALCTTVGYLTMFALELTVGSRFLSGLVAGIPEWITVSLIAIVAFTYLGLGGFRTVIVTDRIMMVFIWLLLLSLIGYYAWFSTNNGGILVSYQNVPESIRNISWNNGLLSFVLGILVMNAFTFVSNMGLFQRVAGAQEPKTVVNGMWSSVVQTLIVWSLFVVVAVGAFTVVHLQPNENLLITLLKAISASTVGKLTIFCVTLGLLGAQLSTASTQLIAVSHTVLEDILGPYRSMSLATRLESSKEVTYSRVVLVLSAIVSIMMVEVLRKIGFSVADMAFSIYGAALGLVPSVLFALFLNREKLSKLKAWANISIAVGFFSGWSCAFYGKFTGDGTIVFLSPCVSLLLSSIILIAGWFIQGANKELATSK